ncbi:MAG: hypothetical protein JXA96_02980 [Sedimentisphaerales bacterium]|nr:hypothetical protein [Sedimentisphaerales bacterium]
MQERNDLKSETKTATKKYITILAVFIIFILSLATLSNSMSKTIGRDEQMYCTGGYLMAQGEMIYRDYSYIAQMPYHPLLYAAVYKLTGTQYYLLTGRLISTICDILIMIFILGIYRHVLKSSIVTGTLLGLAGAVIYVFNPLVDYANGYAWNHDVVILCVMLSLWLFVSMDFKKKPAFWRVAVMGALLTFASCMRITTFLVELLFFIILLCVHADSFKQRLKTVSPFMAASFAMLIWPVWITRNAPKAFYLNLLKIPALNGKWLYEMGIAFNKAGLTFSSFTTPGYFLLLALAILLFVMIIVLRGNIKIENKPKLFLIALLPLVFFIIAFIPITMWPQYLAVPVPFIIASLAFPFSYLNNISSVTKFLKYYKVSIILLIICVIISVAAYPVVIYRIPVSLVPEMWTPIQLHRIAEDIADEMPEKGLVLTLAPLFAIEGNCEIYTELSCGSFVYRIADFLSDEEKQITHTVSPANLSELIIAKPPSAVITNVETMTSLEKTIIDSIDISKWRMKKYENGPIVYFRQ